MSPHLLIAGPSGLPSAGSLRAYVRVWKELRKLPPDHYLPRGFAERWPTTAGAELNEFRRALDNRINTRGLLDKHWVRSISVRDPNTVGQSPVAKDARILRNLMRTVSCRCRNCDMPLMKYRTHSHRFCGSICYFEWKES